MVDHHFEADASRPLDQQQIARADLARREAPPPRRQSANQAVPSALLGGAGRDLARELAHAHHRIEAEARRALSRLAMKARALGPELEHVAEHRPATLRRKLRHRFERARHRVRVRVVAVVVDLRLAGPAQDAAHRRRHGGRGRLRDRLERHAEAIGGGRRRQTVLDVVTADQRQAAPRHRRRRPRPGRLEHEAAAGLPCDRALEVAHAQRELAFAGRRRHRQAVPRRLAAGRRDAAAGDAHHLRIVGVGDHDAAVGRQAGEDLGLGLGDAIERAEELEVHRPHVDQNDGVRARQLARCVRARRARTSPSRPPSTRCRRARPAARAESRRGC